MVAKVGKSFCAILGWMFLGDVLDNISDYISARWSRIVPPQTDVPKVRENLGKSFCAILGWMFLGDVLDFSWTSEKTIFNIQQ